MIAAVGGASATFQFVEAQNHKNEVEQGGNYWLGALGRTFQATSIGVVAQPIFGDSGWVTLATNVIPLIVGGLFFLMAAIKHGAVEGSMIAAEWTIEIADVLLPVIMVAGALALTVLGNFWFAGGMVAMLGLNLWMRSSYMPQKLGLILEKVLPIITCIGMILSGTILSQVIAAIWVVTFIPGASGKMAAAADWAARKVLDVQGPTLFEVDQDWETHMDLSREQVEDIVSRPASDFEIDPAHCNKETLDLEALHKDEEFSKLSTFFTTSKLANQTRLIRQNCLRDERFVLHTLHLKDKSTIAEREEALALLLDGKDEGEYFAQYLTQQMNHVVAVLVGNKMSDGTYRDLLDAKDYLSRIIPYLEQCSDPIERQDILLKIALEGGEYCTRGVKRASQELVYDKFLKGGATVQESFRTELQRLRIAIAHELYINQMKREDVPSALAQDVHVYDTIQLIGNFGFVPLTTENKELFGPGLLPLFYQLHEYRQTLYNIYQNSLHLALEKVGQTKMTAYVRAVLGDKLDNLDFRDDSFNRLFYVMMGVLRLKAPVKSSPAVERPLDAGVERVAV